MIFIEGECLEHRYFYCSASKTEVAHSDPRWRLCSRALRPPLCGLHLWMGCIAWGCQRVAWQVCASGGMGTWTLGLVLQFLIAISAAAIYCLASLRLRFLRDNWLVCGLFYGIAVYLVMNLIVLPLSAFPFPVGPFKVAALIQGLLVHMILIGLPISFSLRRFSS
jgi:hypothetical protein